MEIQNNFISEIRVIRGRLNLFKEVLRPLKKVFAQRRVIVATRLRPAVAGLRRGRQWRSSEKLFGAFEEALSHWSVFFAA